MFSIILLNSELYVFSNVKLIVIPLIHFFRFFHSAAGKPGVYKTFFLDWQYINRHGKRVDKDALPMRNSRGVSKRVADPKTQRSIGSKNWQMMRRNSLLALSHQVKMTGLAYIIGKVATSDMRVNREKLIELIPTQDQIDLS